jgi:hypothetical protein
VPRRKSGSSFDSGVRGFICSLSFSSETFGTADSVPLRKARVKAGNGQGRRPHVPDATRLNLASCIFAQALRWINTRPRSGTNRDAQECQTATPSATWTILRGHGAARRERQAKGVCRGREFRRKSKSIRPGTVGAWRTCPPRTAPRSTGSSTPNAVDTGETLSAGERLVPGDRKRVHVLGQPGDYFSRVHVGVSNSRCENRIGNERRVAAGFSITDYRE